MEKAKQYWHHKDDHELLLTFVTFGTGPSSGVVAYMKKDEKMKQLFSYADVAFLKESHRVIAENKLRSELDEKV